MKLSMSRVVLPLLAVSMAGLGFYHVDRESQSLSEATPSESPAISPFKNAIAASGVVEASTENISLGAALPGLVLEVYVPSDKVGAHVTAGQPLFRVDDRHLKAQLKVAEAQLESAKARLTKLELQPRPEELPPSLAKVKAATANTARLKDQFERAERLVRSGAVTEADLVMKRLSYETAAQEEAQAQADYDLLKAGAWKPDLAIATAEIAQATASIEQLKTEISRATIVSPIDGIVLQVDVRAGERVSDQDGKALMVLGGLDSYHVRVDIDERDIARFHRGASAKAFPRGETSHELGMRFSRVEPLVVPKTSLTGENTERVDTRVLQVIYAIDSADHDVYVGQQLDVFVDGNEARPDGGLVAEK